MSQSKNERIAVIYGARTPMGKAGGSLKQMGAEDLAVHVMKHVMTHSGVSAEDVDEVIVGNVAQPGHAANIARVIALEAGLPQNIPAYTVHRNCASGMEAISSAANLIWAGRAEVIVAAGTESMSNIPLFLSAKMKDLFEKFYKARTALDKIKVLSQLRLGYLKPVVGVLQGLTDPVCGLNMGQTAEVLAKEFHISREEQDAFALQSHLKAIAAHESGFFKQEMVPLPIAPRYDRIMNRDEGPRVGQTIEQLAKLKPYFDRDNGTVTVGNACPITDGAASVILMSESKAKELRLEPLGYITDYAYAGLEGSRMGLGPVYATSKLLEQTGLSMDDFDLIELNEAFAAQVIGCMKAFESDAFSQKYLGRDKSLGAIDPEKLNIHGGAIAMGHPVGMTGTRLILTLLHSLKESGQERGLATLCIGGGQGAAFALERD